LAVFVSYSNSLKAPFIFDDEAKIIDNPDIKKIENIETKLVYHYGGEFEYVDRNDPSRPVVYLTFTLNYFFGKLNTFGYHLFNVILHIFNSILIFLLLKKIFYYVFKEDTNFFPLLGALFFAVSPINTEVVTYIFHRSESLAVLFYLLSLLLFIKTFENRKYAYVLSLICFILALFSKESAATLPAIALLFDYIFLSEFKLEQLSKRKYYHIAYWVILVGYLLFRQFYLGGLGDRETDPYTRWSNYTYFIVQPYVVLRYLQMLIAPVGLCIDHWIIPAKTILQPKILLSFLVIIGILVQTFKTYKKKTGISKIVLFSCLWFFISLSPTSSILPIKDAMADRRVYLPGIGFFMALALMYYWLATKIKDRRWILYGIIGVHILLLGILTYNRNRLYSNPVLMWRSAVSEYPNNARAHINLGNVYKDDKEYNAALQEYQTAVKLDPDNSRGHDNLGNMYAVLGAYDKATPEFEKAISINPYYAATYSNLGSVYNRLKQYDKAFEEYSRAIQLNPTLADAYNNLGVLYINLGKYDGALKAFQKVVELNPDLAETRMNMGVIYSYQKEYGKAINEFRKALELNPNYANVHTNLALLYYIQKDYQNSIQECRKVLELDPGNKDANSILSAIQRIPKQN